MIIYNVTVKIDHDTHDEWLDWMKNKHIPDVMNTGCFMESKILRVLVDEEDGKTYSFQYTCENEAKLNEYTSKFAPTLQREHALRYDNKFVAFRTLLEVVK